jgi:hypothetical protein
MEGASIMATEQFGALIPDTHLAIAAWKYQMLDASRTELVKVCLLMLIPGMSLDEAKRRVISKRNPPQMTDGKAVLNVRVAKEDLDQVKQVMPDLTNSQLLRYAVIRSTEDHESALDLAVVPRGCPRKQSA